uniref:Uncharacterized protein n=1 Tax=viral metagenome TaxID=1070528 RepID=A0A6C0HL43_9ZZZZ
MAESGVKKTVVVRNGESFQVSIRPANGPVSMVESGVIKTVVRNGKSFQVSIQRANKPVSMVKSNTPTTVVRAAPASAAIPTVTVPAATTAPFVAPIVAFMNKIQQTYNQSNMTEDAIDKEISELQVKDGPVNADLALLDKNIQKKVELGRATFAEYIKKIIENERGRIEKIGANAVRQHHLQKNTRPTFFKEKVLAAKQKEYDDAFSAENEQQARYIAATRKLGDSEKEYPIIFSGLETRVKEANELKEAKQREVEKLDNERTLLQISDPNASLSSANQQKIDEAENKYNAAFKELDKLTKLQFQRSIIKNKVSTLEDYKAEQERLANEEKVELNKLKQISTKISKETIKIQQELREIEAENKQEEDKAKNTSIISSIQEIVGKVIPLITTRLNAMNEVEKAIKAGLADYLINRTIDETERSDETLQNATRSFATISNDISDKNADLPKYIIDRMIEAAAKVHSSKLQSLSPSTFNLEDTAAKVKIKQEFYNMESPKWEKSIFGLSGGRRTLRRKMVRRKTRRIIRSY